MKPGKTILKENHDPRFPPTVQVGADDRRVYVDFGSITITLAAQGDGSTVIIRGDTNLTTDYTAPLLRLHIATDVKNTVEFTIESEQWT